MLLHVSHIHRPWVQNHDWLDKLQKCPDKEVRDEAQATFQLLAKVQWTAPKSGFSDKLPIQSLAYTGNALDELDCDFVVVMTDVVEKLVTLFGGKNEDHDGYLKCKWLQSIGRQAFEDGKTMVTVTHLGKLPPQRGGTGLDHWVPLAINGLDCIFFYGDSLCRKETPTLPPTLLKTLNAWKGIHSSHAFSQKVIPISPQDDDFSCGPCAINAIEHLVRPETAAIAEPRYIDSQNIAEPTSDDYDECGIDIIDHDPGTSSVDFGIVLDTELTYQADSSPGTPGPNALQSFALEHTPKPDRHSLDDFLVLMTKEELTAATKHEFEILAVRTEKREEKANKEEHEKKLQKREMGRIRQQKFRDRRQTQRIESGWTDQQGKKQKLRDYDDDDEENDLAEASRPHRLLKQDIRDQKRNEHTHGRKPTKIQKPAQ
ncbi:hypothetical protein DFJ43DRAFT_1154456 [Lentinula guzmanii]|uniref:Ubiquitin-like protease family profile domain-containing protein n=1 Tax=Lentinula guzmanii TaxID=2804957 RepID=A0AA38JLE7_9AGAR|nr:hypothetical protein DFJ43DRAFT_1154456 [Lentinula guzmanii]